MKPGLKKNVEVFNKDILENAGYKYSTNASFSSVVANRRMTNAITEKIDNSASALIDIGCGDGFYTNELKEKFPSLRIVAVDPAMEAIKMAKELYPEVEFYIADILNKNSLSELKLENFDVAVIRGVLHHLSNPELAIKNTACIAKKIVIVEPNGNNPILKLIEKFSPYHREHEERSFSSSLLKEWCKKNGLFIISIDYIGFVPMFFPSILARIIYFFQPFLEKVPMLKNIFSAQIVIYCKQNEMSHE